MDDISLSLQDAHNCVQMGKLPSKSFRELASAISACINSPVVTSLSSSSTETDYGRDQNATENNFNGNNVTHYQLALLGLSLVEKMSVKLLDHELPQDLILYTQNLFRTLNDEFSFILSALSIFGSNNRLLSHVASKSLSSLLIYELQSSNTCGIVIEKMCEEALQKNPSCCKIDSTIWCLTTVIKKILKRKTECTSEPIELLLTRMDSLITSWYTSLLQTEDSSKPGDWGTTLITFMDLLEVLTAARFQLGTCISSQRLLFIRTPALLKLLGSQLDYFLKKHVLLLLKRTLLQRNGEDWLPGTLNPTTRRDAYLAEDMGALTDSILQAVNSDWLVHVPVRPSPSFFGGTIQSCSDDRADDVMLRAVSLVLLKSLEYQTKSTRCKSGSQTIHILTHLNKLLLFLRQHCAQLRQSCHPCVCMSVVFVDQDDDMIEAARALIVLHTHQKSLCEASEASACEMGLNPHCHFVLLLRGLAFDHSVLLDFLISSETCFLEYFVRYLKLLRDDWEGFCRTCQLLETQDFERHDPGRRKRSSQPSPTHTTSTYDGGRGSHSNDSPSEVCMGPSLCPRLVDYGSSEDSGEEEEEAKMDVLAGSSDTGQRTAAGSPSSGAGRLCITLPGRKESLEASNEPRAFVKCTQTCLARRAVLCLKELRTVVARLQKKNLFPYNPASLLKLLNLIEEKSVLVL